MALIFVSYRMEGVDSELAANFAAALRAVGHDVFLAGDSIRIGDNWRAQVETNLAACDYFLVLLSERAALSEMVIAEVRRARQRQSDGENPVILPIRVRHPISKGLAYDLEAYLEHVQQREWSSDADTPKLLQELVQVIAMRTKAFGGSVAPAALERPNDGERPIPIADPEPLGAPLVNGAQFYVERPRLDAEVLALASSASRQLIKLHGPEQFGKSSLLSRIVARANGAGLRAASLSFQLAVDGQLETAQSGIEWFCRLLTKRLGQPRDFFKVNWPAEDGSAGAALEYLVESLLPTVASSVVIGIDNLDQAFDHAAFSQSFLPLLRELFDLGADNPELGKLRIVLAYSTECWIELPENISPFGGVGYGKTAPPFASAELDVLCLRHQLALSSKARTDLLGLLGGHPYLTRLALHETAKATSGAVYADEALGKVVRDAATDEGIFGDHLRKKLFGVVRHLDARLKDALRTAVRSNTPVSADTQIASRLVGSGLVRRLGNNIEPASAVYRDYFRAKL